MAVDAPVKITPPAGVGAESMPYGFVIAPSVTETNQNDHQYDFNTLGANTLAVVVSITANTGAISLTVTIEGVTADGVVVPLLVSAVLVAVAVTKLQVGPSLAVTANVAANSPIFDKIRILTTHGNANSVTYSLSGVLTTA